MNDKNIDTIEIIPPHTAKLPPPPRKASMPPSLPIDNEPPDEPQFDSVALESAEPSPLPEQQPSYPQHQLIIERSSSSGIMLRTLFFASIGFGLGILIGVGFLLG